MAKTCERAEVHFALGEKCLGVASIENFPENNGQVSFCTGILELDGINYRPAFYWAAQIPHLALLPEDVYVEYIHGKRRIVLDDWAMVLMLDRDEKSRPTTTRRESFRGIEITSFI